LRRVGLIAIGLVRLIVVGSHLILVVDCCV